MSKPEQPEYIIEGINPWVTLSSAFSPKTGRTNTTEVMGVPGGWLLRTTLKDRAGVAIESSFIASRGADTPTPEGWPEPLSHGLSAAEAIALGGDEQMRVLVSWEAESHRKAVERRAEREAAFKRRAEEAKAKDAAESDLAARTQDAETEKAA
jgi:hypothetical protein